MNRIIALIILTAFISLVFGYDEFNSDYPKKATIGIVAAEFGGGLVCGFGGAIIGGFAGDVIAPMFNDEPTEIMGPTTTYLISAVIGWTFGCAGGTCLAGACFRQGGKFLPTLAGASLVTVVGVSAGYLLDQYEILLPTVVLIPVSAVISYNLSRPKPAKQAFLYQHLDLPTFSFRTEKTKENKIIPVYDFRLVNARF